MQCTTNPMKTLWNSIQEFGRMIKFEHTIFALPFALVSLILASGGWPRFSTLGWVLLAAIGARTAAMGFNRLVDQKLDTLNPRTQVRSLPARRLSRQSAWLMVVSSIVIYFVAAGSLNPLCLQLAPLVLIILLGYSYTKRFTSFCHLILGLALACAPMGAWIATTGRLEALPVLIGGGVCFWTAGFDILYALQDLEFDRSQGLHSIPARWGTEKALYFSRFFHSIAWILWAFAGSLSGLYQPMFWVGMVLIGAILIREQWILRKGDLGRLDEAFFQLNAWIGPIYLLSLSSRLISR